MKKYNVIGIMSGTSMDGLDIAHVTLWPSENGKWDYEINAAKTVAYDDKWRLRLSKLRHQNSLVFYKTNRYFGHFIGIEVNKFLEETSLKADLISSHGHTVFHQPENNLTVQVGDGNAINVITNIPTITDFRSANVILGGEGAPLVGLTDSLLFSEYDFSLNLGGFANISYNNGTIQAYDVCPCNVLLNRLAREFEQAYDKDGTIAASGHIDYPLLDELNQIDYYQQEPPKSLGREWISTHFWDYVRNCEADKTGKMKTLVDHIALQIGENIYKLSNQEPDNKRVLITGGGAHNLTLLDHIQTHTDAEIVVPDSQLVDYKEALAFALLGVLRIRNTPNVLAAYTGASQDIIAGSLYGDFSKLLD